LSVLVGASKKHRPERTLAAFYGQPSGRFLTALHRRRSGVGRRAGRRRRDPAFKLTTERFFVRDHTSTPLIDANTWTLSL
jgi:hypothetical protein